MTKRMMITAIAMTDHNFAASIVSKYGRLAERSIRRSGFVYLTPPKRQATSGIGVMRIDVRRSHASYHIKLLHTLNLIKQVAKHQHADRLRVHQTKQVTPDRTRPMMNHSSKEELRASSTQVQLAMSKLKLDTKRLAWLRQTFRREQLLARDTLRRTHVHTHKIAKIVTYRHTLATTETARTVGTASPRDRQTVTLDNASIETQSFRQGVIVNRSGAMDKATSVRRFHLGSKEIRIQYERLEQFVSRLQHRLSPKDTQRSSVRNHLPSTDRASTSSRFMPAADKSRLDTAASALPPRVMVQLRAIGRTAVESQIKQVMRRLPDHPHLRRIDRDFIGSAPTTRWVHRLSATGTGSHLSARQGGSGHGKPVQAKMVAVVSKQPSIPATVETRDHAEGAVPALRLRDGRQRLANATIVRRSMASMPPASDSIVEQRERGIAAVQQRHTVRGAWRQLDVSSTSLATSLVSATSDRMKAQTNTMQSKMGQRFAALLQRWQLHRDHPSTIPLPNARQVALIQRVASRKSARVYAVPDRVSQANHLPPHVAAAGKQAPQDQAKQAATLGAQRARLESVQRVTDSDGLPIVNRQWVNTPQRAVIEPAITPLANHAAHSLAQSITKRIARLHVSTVYTESTVHHLLEQMRAPQRVERHTGLRPLQLTAARAHQLVASRVKTDAKIPSSSREDKSPMRRPIPSQPVTSQSDQRASVASDKPTMSAVTRRRQSERQTPVNVPDAASQIRRVSRSGAMPNSNLQHRHGTLFGVRVRRGPMKADSMVRPSQGLADSQSLVQAATLYMRKLVRDQQMPRQATAPAAHMSSVRADQANRVDHANQRMPVGRRVMVGQARAVDTEQTGMLESGNAHSNGNLGELLPLRVIADRPDGRAWSSVGSRPGQLALLIYGRADMGRGNPGVRAMIRTLDSLTSATTAVNHLFAATNIRRLLQRVQHADAGNISAVSVNTGQVQRRSIPKGGARTLIIPRRSASPSAQTLASLIKIKPISLAVPRHVEQRQSGKPSSASPLNGSAQSQGPIPISSPSRIIVHVATGEQHDDVIRVPAPTSSSETMPASAGVTTRRKAGYSPLVAAPRPNLQRGGMRMGRERRAVMPSPQSPRLTQRQQSTVMANAIPQEALGRSALTPATVQGIETRAGATRAPSLMHKQATLRAQFAETAVGTVQQVERRQSSRPISLEFAIRTRASSGSKFDQEGVIRQSLQQLQSDVKELNARAAAPPIDVMALSDKMYREISQRMRFEQQRRGL